LYIKFNLKNVLAELCETVKVVYRTPQLPHSGEVLKLKKIINKLLEHPFYNQGILKCLYIQKQSNINPMNNGTFYKNGKQYGYLQQSKSSVMAGLFLELSNYRYGSIKMTGFNLREITLMPIIFIFFN